MRHQTAGRNWRRVIGKEVTRLRHIREKLTEITQNVAGWERGSLPWAKRLVREVDHSPLSSAEVKNEWSYTSTPLQAFREWSGATLAFLL